MFCRWPSLVICHASNGDLRSGSPYRAAFTTKTVKVGENSVLFQIWDTAGQEKVREGGREGGSLVL